MHKIVGLTLVLLLLVYQTLTDAYFSTCEESAGRECPASDNRTQYLMTMKKGGAEILSTDVYMEDFYLCEQFNYDCGYLPEDQSFATIANGCELDMDETELLSITQAYVDLQEKIKPYLNLQGDTAKCGMSLFPLTLLANESSYFLDKTMTNLQTQVINKYNADRDTLATKTWGDININIRTAVLSKLQDTPSLLGNSVFWTKTCLNEFTEVSKQLKKSYEVTKDVKQLHEAYLIDAVTIKCNKTQSITFLMDESGSIGLSDFLLSKDFLEMYLNQTNDDYSLLSIHYFGTLFRSGVPFGNTFGDLLAEAQDNYYEGSGTYTGQAMKTTIDLIKGANFDNGLPKILVVMTDGDPSPSSTVPLSTAYQYAAAQDIVVIAVGIGAGINQNNLLLIAGGNPSNFIKISNYADLPKLVQFISNYFCKQIVNVKLDQTIVNNQVRVPTSPSYFRVEKSQQGQFYELDVVFEEDHRLHEETTFQSQIDPFPDQYTELEAQYYEIIPTRRLLTEQNTKIQKLGNSLPTLDKFMKIFFIYPEEQIDYTVKKTITSTMNTSVSYVAIRGYDMRFNITLKICSTFNCSQQRQILRGYKPIDPTPTPNPDQYVILTPQDEDLSIFAIIGGTLAAMALCCILMILGIRRMKDDQQQQNKEQNENIMSQNTENIIANNNNKSKKSSKSSKKSSSKSSSRSSKSSKNSQSVSSD